MYEEPLNLARYRDTFGLAQKMARVVWFWVWLLLFRPTPRPMHAWRRWLLQLFGARMARHARVYASARIWAPWNLVMGEYACIGEGVRVYNVARIELGAHTVVSQFAHLCAAGHDYRKVDFPLLAEPIRIGPHAWVCADAFVAPGITVGEAAVVGARAAVFKDVPAWSVVGGNPAVLLKTRSMPGAAQEAQTDGPPPDPKVSAGAENPAWPSQ